MKIVRCRCGYAFNLSKIDVPGQHYHLAQERWDELVESLATAALAGPASDPVLLRERLSDALAVQLDSFFRCPSCARLTFVSRDQLARESLVREPP